MPGFEEAYSAVNKVWDGESVSPDLQPFLRSVYHSIVSAPPDLRGLKKGLEQLLTFLDHEGRTNANCSAVDLFFMSSEGWERDWTDQDLPEEFHDILSLMGEALHDTVKAPQVAANFDCLPSQLLQRVRNIKI